MKPKNILVLTGSPRKGGNSMMMAEAFAHGAGQAGHQVTFFNTADTNIEGCTACDTCWSKGKPCSFDDGFDELYPLMEAADAIVYSAPLYWFTFPAPMKAAIDKMYAYAGNRSPRPLSIKESVLMACGGDAQPDIFDGIKATYRHIAGYMNWNDRGILAVPGVHRRGDIKSTDALEKAEELGRSL